MYRRRFLQVCCGSLAAAALGRQTEAAQFPPGGSGRGGRRKAAEASANGCYLNAQQGAALGALSDGRSPSCGIPWLDAMMPVEAQYLNKYFGTAAGFTFLIEGQGSNAFATPNSFFPGTRGTVLFGVQLIREELAASRFGTIAVAAIMAHEWGHILQFDNRIQVPGKRMELSGDFMAGWWCGMKVLAGTPAVDMFTVGNSLYGKGDYAFNSPQHHGTPDERVQQMQSGYVTATQRGVTNAQAAFQLSRQSVGL